MIGEAPSGPTLAFSPAVSLGGVISQAPSALSQIGSLPSLTNQIKLFVNEAGEGLQLASPATNVINGAQASSAGNLKPCTYLGCQNLCASEAKQLCKQHVDLSMKKSWRECKFDGCHKCRQGNTQFCKQHGGGRKCQMDSCTKLARGKMYCASHGGGKRCSDENCNRMAVGAPGKCIAHGGGKRCQYAGCTKASQYSWSFCSKHGALVQSQFVGGLAQLAAAASAADVA